MLTTFLSEIEKEQPSLKTFQVNARVLVKLSKKKKLNRILSIAQSLRELGKSFWWFHANAIVIELQKANYKKCVVLIVATPSHYRVRVESRTFADGGSFFEKEIDQNNGNRLLWDLVTLEILDTSYLPKVTSLHQRINDL